MIINVLDLILKLTFRGSAQKANDIPIPRQGWEYAKGLDGDYASLNVMEGGNNFIQRGL